MGDKWKLLPVLQLFMVPPLLFREEWRGFNILSIWEILGQPGENSYGQLHPPNQWPGSVNTPVRPPGLGVEGAGINPFWSPEVRAIGEGMQSVGEVGLLARARRAVQQESPTVEMDPVELFRLRCMREAEEKFLQGLERMKGKPHPEEFHIGSTESYRSCANIAETTPDGKPKSCEVQGGNHNGNLGKPREEGLPRKGENRDGSLWGKRVVGETITETLRSVDLPPLELETTALGFGDWLTLIGPQMADVSYTSGDWWDLVMGAVRSTYEEWLKKDPLGRLKIQVQRPEGIDAWPRTEKRVVNMLLQAIPEKLKLELVASRKLTATHIMFKLYCLYQPGGQAEGASLLMTDQKMAQTPSELASNLRQWIRLLSRSEELDLVLPDPMVLAGVLGKFSDSLSKLGTQVGFRLASTRQQLQMDSRPTLPDVKTFAEYLLAEAEDLTVNVQVSVGSSGNPKPAVKSLGCSDQTGRDDGKPQGPQPVNAGQTTSKVPCRFWGTDEGCRKADKCKFVHTLVDPKDNRCFLCSGVGHGKKDCPQANGKRKVAKTQTEKGSRKGEKGKGKGSAETSDRNPKNETEGKGWEPRVGEASSSGDSVSKTLGSTPQNPPNPELNELLREASTLMKTLRPVLKAIHFKEGLKKANTETVQTGLLDGGATNALRKGSKDEISRAELVTVELASGTTQLYQDMITGTLLTTSEVEPIVPLRGVVDLGYKIKWDRNGCVVMHPVYGKLVCWLRNGCPVVREEHALQLGIWKTWNDNANLNPKWQGKPLVMKCKVGGDKISLKFPRMWLLKMTGQKKGKPDGNLVPWNRRKRRQIETAKAVVIHLFAGENASEWRKGWPDGVETLTLEITESPNQDLHDPNVWGYLTYVASKKRILGIVGGPPCRTVSRLRNIRPGPNPLRGRVNERFGLMGLTEREQQLTDSDSALMLKQLALLCIAEEAKPPESPETGFLMESPEDPAAYAGESEAPTFWAWPEVQAFKDRFGLRLIAFDQGQIGHPQTKPTMCLTNLEGVEKLNGVRCGKRVGENLCPDLPGRMAQTASWSAWAPGLKLAIRDSLVTMGAQWDFITPKAKRVNDYDQWVNHVKQGHRPYRRDCRACILDMACGPPHRRRMYGGTSAWSLGVDVVLMTPTKDECTGKDAKYVVAATALIPVFDEACQPPFKKPPPELIEDSSWGEGLMEEEFPLGIEEKGEEIPEGAPEKDILGSPDLGHVRVEESQGKQNGDNVDAPQKRKNGDEANQPEDFDHTGSIGFES